MKYMYIVYIENGAAFVEIVATDVTVTHSHGLLFFDDRRQPSRNSEYDAPAIAYFPPGSYDFFYMVDVGEVK